ncbi:BSPAL1 [Symbiodinium sp. CCMP2592]|nr:BSPAL1 [Symbiodinium sp. CCMP2592]
MAASAFAAPVAVDFTVDMVIDYAMGLTSGELPAVSGGCCCRQDRDDCDKAKNDGCDDTFDLNNDASMRAKRSERLEAEEDADKVGIFEGEHSGGPTALEVLRVLLGFRELDLSPLLHDASKMAERCGALMAQGLDRVSGAVQDPVKEPVEGDTHRINAMPLLRLEDLERFVLQTTAPEDEGYLEWCRRIVSRRIAERPFSQAGREVAHAEAGRDAWKPALVTSFDLIAKLPVHTLRYEDGEEAKLLLHLREVVLLPSSEEPQETNQCENRPSEESAAQDDASLPEAGRLSEEANADEGLQDTETNAARQADPTEKVHKLIVRMPMVQAGDIPFDMVWGDLLESGEALLQASPDGTWTALGWKDRTEMKEAFSQGLEATGEGTLARGMTREEGVLLLERMDELADAMEVVVDRNDVPTSRQKSSKPAPTAGPICRRVQLDLPCGSTVGVAVWEHATGCLDVVDQTGRFLPSVPSEKIASASRRARHAPGRSLPLELSVLGLTSGVDTKASGEASGSFEWQFAGDSGWCNFEPAACRLLEAAQQRGEAFMS